MNQQSEQTDTAEKLLDLEFKMAMTNMLRALMGKVDNMQEQTSNTSRDGYPKKSKSKC